MLHIIFLVMDGILAYFREKFGRVDNKGMLLSENQPMMFNSPLDNGVEANEEMSPQSSAALESPDGSMSHADSGYTSPNHSRPPSEMHGQIASQLSPDRSLDFSGGQDAIAFSAMSPSAANQMDYSIVEVEINVPKSSKDDSMVNLYNSPAPDQVAKNEKLTLKKGKISAKTSTPKGRRVTLPAVNPAKEDKDLVDEILGAYLRNDVGHLESMLADAVMDGQKRGVKNVVDAMSKTENWDMKKRSEPNGSSPPRDHTNDSPSTSSTNSVKDDFSFSSIGVSPIAALNFSSASTTALNFSSNVLDALQECSIRDDRVASILASSPKDLYKLAYACDDDEE